MVANEELLMSTDPLPPLAPAATIVPGNRPRAWFDDGIAFAIEEEARRRAPTTDSRFRHKVGFAGELATSAYLRGPVNRTIYDDFEGDDGYDVMCTVDGCRRRVEVKTVHSGELELVVDEDGLEAADYFVLCRTTNPTSMVELVGWADRGMVIEFGECYPGDGKVRVTPDSLGSFDAVHLSPDRIRNAQVLG